MRAMIVRANHVRLPIGCCLLLLASVFALASASPGPASSAWKPDNHFRSITLGGAGSVRWAVTFGSKNVDWVNRVIQSRNGDLVAVGFVDRPEQGPPEWDAFAHRFDVDGNAIWTRRFGGRGMDAVWSVCETNDGQLGLAGFSVGDTLSDTDVWLLALDGEGSTQLERRFGGERDELCFDLVCPHDGGYLLVGQTESSGAGERDVFLVRTDAQGREQWRRTFGGEQVDRGFYAVATPDSGFVVAGVTGPQGAYDMLVLRVDAEGNEMWRQVIGGEANDPNHGINLLPDGRIVVVGYTASYDASEHDVVAVSLSPAGEVLSHEILSGPGDDRVMNSVTGADGETWLVGYTTSFGSGDWDVMVARLTPEGRFEPWMGAIGTSFDDNGTTVVRSAAGALVIGGYTNAPSQGSEPADLLLFEVDGATIEHRTKGIEVRRFR